MAPVPIISRCQKVFLYNLKFSCMVFSASRLLWTNRSLGFRKCRVNRTVLETQRNRKQQSKSNRQNKIAQTIFVGLNGGVEDDNGIRFLLRPRIFGQTGNYRSFVNERQISSIFEIKPSSSDTLSPEKTSFFAQLRISGFCREN